jgi:DNA-binding Lrp family transcriptional regulator
MLCGMVTAIVFISADVARIPEVAQEVAAIEGVGEVYSVTGDIDLIAIIRVADHEDLATVIPDHVNKVPGVLSTETHIAFRTYSTQDVEAAFSLGASDEE